MLDTSLTPARRAAARSDLTDLIRDLLVEAELHADRRIVGGHPAETASCALR